MDEVDKTSSDGGVSGGNGAQGSTAVDGELLDLGSVDVAEVATAVRETPDETLREALQGDARGVVLGEIFRRFPAYVDQSRLNGVEAAVEWRITDGEEVERYITVFSGGACTVGRDLEAEPRVTFTLDPVDFVRLVTGNGNPATMFLGGRLDLEGDRLFALEMAGFLRIPGNDGEPSAAAGVVDPSRADAIEIARVVGQTDDETLARGMQGEIRDLILDEIFRRMPEHAHGSLIHDLDGVIGFKITGPGEGEADRFKVALGNGTISAGRDVEGEPRVTIVTDAVTFLKLATGNANPQMSFLTGKIRLKGDIIFAARIPGLFRIPSAAG
jgi:putative sterol carrier protein